MERTWRSVSAAPEVCNASVTRLVCGEGEGRRGQLDNTAKPQLATTDHKHPVAVTMDTFRWVP